VDTEAIDYQALYEKVSEELTQARIAILKMRQARSPLDAVDTKSARKWLMENYFLIIVGVLVFSVLLSVVDTVGKLHKRKGEDK